ncbi:CHAT domain protein [Posidoniimonas polymericola]|uniref:CHAT domain protein n=1 Tax=Posidoniimonas polymericola TaxID=2528002 RepID=A0A5C5YFI4_9BACT|nr:CHAT domain-containing protein [Posidoniimonas polymericola]TWT73834.1 CHAT domain protein [Posidoniimonas polymericola]
MKRTSPAQALIAMLVLAAALLAPRRADAQTGAVPGPSYYLAVESIYEGDYQDAARDLLREQRGSIKTVTSRWVDSICFYAMRGEALYQMGLNQQALLEFNRACELFLANHNWMLRVRFTQDPRPDPNGRRLAPWGRPTRNVTYGRLPDTMLFAFGNLNNNAAASQGGLVQMPQFWKIDVAEVMRTAALAIRRRNTLLGPLGPHDALSRDLADTLSRGNLAPPNHWSSSWADLVTGLALMGVYKPLEAGPCLVRAELLGGRYDHELTGAALLAQAMLTLGTEEDKQVPRLTSEAILAAFAYEDWDTVADALGLQHVHRQSLAAEGVEPTLPDIANWAQRERFNHIAAQARLILAEQHAAARHTDEAAALVASALPRRSDVANGRLGAYADYVAAMAALQAGKQKAGQQSLEKSLQRYSELSLSNFQLALANERFDAGELSPRVAVDVYKQMLTDPAPLHWAYDTMDAMCLLRTNHEPAFDRWITASLARRETLPALYAADLAKRRRFLSHQPLGGRLLTLRTLLEAPDAELDKAQRLERQVFSARSPGYRPVSEQAAAARSELADAKTLFSDDARRDQRLFTQLSKATALQEAMLTELALHRLPTELSFPPRRSAEDIRKRMQPGDALLVFHQMGDTLHGFVLVSGGEHYWRLPDAGVVRGKIAELLNAIGNYSNNKGITDEDLQDDAWRQLATALGDALLQESRLDLSQTKRLIIVPDGPLWHLPFEALIIGEPSKRQLIADVVMPRYAPTMGLALAKQDPPRLVQHTAIVTPHASGDDETREMQQMTWDGLSGVLAGPTKLPTPSPVPSATLISAFESAVVMTDSVLAEQPPYDWSPLPIDRTTGGTLADWERLPYEGPERVVLAGLRTAAENGLKSAGGRRSRRGKVAALPLGQEVFHAACGLMASGAQTVLMSRWQTGGAVHRQLVQEFVTDWTRTPATDAWRRSVTLARTALLDPYQEPRLKLRDLGAEPPSADHPFFWSGYLLIDAGYEPPPEELQEAGPGDAENPPAAPAAA